MPRRRLYRANQSDTYNEMVAITMPQNRFEKIMKFFHGTNNANMHIDDEFAKVQPLLNILNRSFLAFSRAFGPTDVWMDESMNPYCDRHQCSL